MRPLLLLVAAAVAAGCRAHPPATADSAHLSDGVAAGEVSDRAVVVWGRCDRSTTLHAQIDGGGAGAVAVDARSDFTGKLAFDDLTPRTTYRYRMRCGDGAAATGTFRTAPAADEAAAVRFAWGGDVGGQNVCRDRRLDYPIFNVLAERRYDFFIGLGDMIYADDPCHATGRYGNEQLEGPPPANDLPGFRAHWHYNWSEPNFQRLRRETAYYGVWDDHEIRNDSGPSDDESATARGVHLLQPALTAFLEYQPLIPPTGEPTRLYRHTRWGKHVEVFLLDTRQYRDPLAAHDGAERPKTMLGTQQRAWLTDAVAGSDATWKIIVSSVPLSIPTGSAARDGFADGGTGLGYEREAAALLDALHRDPAANVLWITTDVHFATGFEYRPFAADPQWVMYEFTSGPLNAGVFPRPDLDTTFHPSRLFLYGPPSPDAIPSFAAAIHWFNFGEIRVDTAGTLTVGIVAGEGQTVFERTLQPRSAENSRRSG
jgi:alkaline phosphatase D